MSLKTEEIVKAISQYTMRWMVVESLKQDPSQLHRLLALRLNTLHAGNITEKRWMKQCVRLGGGNMEIIWDKGYQCGCQGRQLYADPKHPSYQSSYQHIGYVETTCRVCNGTNSTPRLNWKGKLYDD